MYRRVKKDVKWRRICFILTLSVGSHYDETRLKHCQILAVEKGISVSVVLACGSLVANNLTGERHYPVRLNTMEKLPDRFLFKPVHTFIRSQAVGNRCIGVVVEQRFQRGKFPIQNLHLVAEIGNDRQLLVLPAAAIAP